MKILIYVALFSVFASLSPAYSFEIIPLKLELAEKKSEVGRYSGCTEDYAETEQCLREFENCMNLAGRKEIIKCFEKI